MLLLLLLLLGSFCRRQQRQQRQRQRQSNERTKRMRAFMLSRSDATSNYRYVYEMNGRRAAENIIIMRTTSLREALSLCLPLPVTPASTNKRQQRQRAHMSVQRVCVCAHY